MTPRFPAPQSVPASVASPSKSISLQKAVGWASVAIIAVVCLWFVRRHCAYLATDSDISGYLNVAQRLLSGHLVQHVPDVAGLRPPAWNYDFQRPLGFSVDAYRGTMVTTYPVGFPLHLLAAAPFVGLEYATIAVNVCLVAAAGILMFALGRELRLSHRWALAGVALLWTCPLFIQCALQPMSDLPATVWTMAAIWCALRARDRWPWGFAAGFAVAVAVLVRPSDLLVIVPVALALGWRGRAWIALATGGLPGAAFLAWYNLALYGTIVTTGYGDVGHLFSSRFVPHNVLHFAFWIPMLLSPFVVLAALALPGLWRGVRPVAVVLTAWAVVFVGFYVFYFHAGETWWYLRFILPMFPAVILASLAVARHWQQRLPSPSRLRWLPAAGLVAVVGWQVAFTERFDIVTLKHGDGRYRNIVEWMRAHAPADAIVVQMQLSGCFTYYTHLALVRWDIITPAGWVQLRTAARAAHRPIFATLFDFERETPEWQQLTGDWQLLDRRGEITIWRLADNEHSTSPAANVTALRP